MTRHDSNHTDAGSETADMNYKITAEDGTVLAYVKDEELADTVAQALHSHSPYCGYEEVQE